MGKNRILKRKLKHRTRHQDQAHVAPEGTPTPVVASTPEEDDETIINELMTHIEPGNGASDDDIEPEAQPEPEPSAEPVPKAPANQASGEGWL